MEKKVLVVDDDQYIRDLYVEILKDEGFIVDEAVNGEEGLQKLLKGGYNLTLLDVMMPKLDGVAVLKALHGKQLPVPNGPILLLTNLGHDPVIQEALNNGATTYLIKDELTPEDLIKHIHQYI